jgi:hypothetical protein
MKFHARRQVRVFPHSLHDPRTVTPRCQGQRQWVALQPDRGPKIQVIERHGFHLNSYPAWFRSRRLEKFADRRTGGAVFIHAESVGTSHGKLHTP